MDHLLLLKENPDRILNEVEDLLYSVTQNKRVRSGRITEHPIAKKIQMPPEDQREDEAVELLGLEDQVTVSSSLFSADYFLQDTFGFSQPFGEIPS